MTHSIFRSLKENKKHLLTVILAVLILTSVSPATCAAQDKSPAEIWIDEVFQEFAEPCESEASEETFCIQQNLLKLSERGNIFAGLFLVSMYSPDPDYVQKLTDINKSNNASQALIDLSEKNSKAQYLLSMLYADGIGEFEKNEIEAIKLATKAVEGGIHDANFLLYELLSRTNPAEAEIWLNKFLENGQQ